MYSKNGVLARVMYSLAGNVLRSALTLIASVVVARSIGPEDFGRLGFLMASFNVITQFIDMGTSNAFLTFISKKIRSKRYLLYYFSWLVVQFLIVFAFISVLAPDYLLDKVWLGESRYIILLAFVAVFFQQNIWLTVSRMGESQRLTGIVQILSVSVGVLHLIFIFLLIHLETLSLEALLTVISLEIIIIVILSKYILPIHFSENDETISEIFKGYKRYCAPLVPMTWITLAASFLDTWLLQRFGGAEQQAYYAVAMQLSVISLIAARSLINILWKEVAEAYSKSDIDAVKTLFNRALTSLFCFGLAISSFLIPWAGEIINLTLGDAYLPGLLVMMIMFVYPVDQARGQVSGTMLLATEQTRISSIIAITSSFFGILLSYVMLAPRENMVPGLELGAFGLAIKMVVIQFLTVNATIFFINRDLRAKTRWLEQFFYYTFFILSGFIAKYLASSLHFFHQHTLASMFISALFYLAILTIFLWFMPSLFGLKRRQLLNLLKLIYDFSIRLFVRRTN